MSGNNLVSWSELRFPELSPLKLNILPDDDLLNDLLESIFFVPDVADVILFLKEEKVKSVPIPKVSEALLSLGLVANNIFI